MNQNRFAAGYIHVSIPNQAKVIKHIESWCPNGDGDYHAIFQFNKEQTDEFLKNIAKKSQDWERMPDNKSYVFQSRNYGYESDEQISGELDLENRRLYVDAHFQ